MPVHTRTWATRSFSLKVAESTSCKIPVFYENKGHSHTRLEPTQQWGSWEESTAEWKDRSFPGELWDPLYLKHRLKQSVSLNTHMSAPDTHFHQKLQLKHQTIDIHAHLNCVCCSFTIITLLHYVITVFTSLLSDSVNIFLSLLDFTQLVKLWFLRLITYYIAVHIYHQWWHL